MTFPALNVSPLCRSVNDGVVTSRDLLVAALGGKRDPRGDCLCDDLPKNPTTSRYHNSRGCWLGEGSNYLKSGVYFGLSVPHDALWYFTAPSHFHTLFSRLSFGVAGSAQLLFITNTRVATTVAVDTVTKWGRKLRPNTEGRFDAVRRQVGVTHPEGLRR